MVDKDEALKLALEHIEGNYTVSAEEAIAAIKEALAQPEQESDDLTAAYLSGLHDGKNTPQRKPEQEPEAMRYDFDGYGWLYIDNGSGSSWREKIKNAEPLYTTPPQREWVGLTEEEKESFGGLRWGELFTAIEAKLREKNT